MDKGLQLSKDDIIKYQKEIDKVDLKEKEDILARSIIKINELLVNPKMDQFQRILIQEINILYNILNSHPNLETSVQQKIVFALKYFIEGNDEIPDEIPGMGFIDDLAVVEWIIKEIKDQYSHYFQA